MPALSPQRSTRRSAPETGFAHETGFVLIVTLLILLALSGLVAAVATSSIDVNSTSSQVGIRNRALGVADAGLHQALYRLNVTGATTPVNNVSLANGASYSYTISPLTASTSPCAGLWVTSGGQQIQQDCITSTGTVDGLSVIAQYRVVGYTAPPPLSQVNGILTNGSFNVGQNFGATGDVGSNGTMTIGNGGPPYVHGKLEPPSGPEPAFCKSDPQCSWSPHAVPIPIPTPTADSDASFVAARSTNSDSAVNWAAAGFALNASTDVLTAGNTSTVTLPSGTYYFCSIDIGSSNTVKIQASIVNGMPVVIYVDSPYDAATGGALSSSPGSGCASGTGNIAGKNDLTFTNPSGLPSDLQIYMYGGPVGPPPCITTCQTNVGFNNLTMTNVELFAPYSSLVVKNNLIANGALVLATLTTGNNSLFSYGGNIGGGGNDTNLTVYFPSAHQICVAGSSTC